MMFALNFMAVRLSQKFSLSNFLIHNKANGRNICRVNASNNEFPLRGNIGGGAGGGTAWRLSAVPSPGYKKLKF